MEIEFFPLAIVDKAFLKNAFNSNGEELLISVFTFDEMFMELSRLGTEL
jgi:hypothetical protein